MNSTESSMNSYPENLKTKWVETIGKLQVLPRLLTTMRLKNSLEAEDDLAQRDAEAYHQLLHGDRAGSPKKSGDEMGDNIYLGDYRVDQHLPSKPQSSGLAKAVLGAGLLASGAGAAYGLPLIADALTPETQIEPETETDPEVRTQIFDYEIGEPVVE